MASIVRPAVFRQSCLRLTTKKSFSTKPSSSFPAIKKPASSTLSKNAKTVAPSSVRIAAFHASGRKAILPPLPQSIDGTANEAAKIPPSNPAHGSYHWSFERLLSVGLVPLTIAPFAAGSLNPMTDALICGTILLHSHIGFDALITDYLPNRRVPKTKKTFDWGLRLATVVVGVGLYEFETNDVGLTEAIKRIWKA
ncbi:hypothetical protein HYALB_00010164 [Hymenoscyphus albidus]|uniref:Succinate dehydrogenase [ubiquinone] cytochrome b small subunit n=1 Tax=Hymenoscyphus albidus TaxID=595503 RepID=A0A9N9M0D0_9HELO|nr:hypothetical protein HYALB_00010164 [Hymenoscyphus albidus]